MAPRRPSTSSPTSSSTATSRRIRRSELRSACINMMSSSKTTRPHPSPRRSPCCTTSTRSSARSIPARSTHPTPPTSRSCSTTSAQRCCRSKSSAAGRKTPTTTPPASPARSSASWSRDYASANTRLRAVVERERKMPQVLLDARKNLKNPPKIFTEIALEQIDGLVGFFADRRPRRLRRRQRPSDQGRVRQDQRRRHPGPEGLRRVDEVRPAAALERRLQARRRHLPQEARSTTRWSTSRSTACSKIAYADLHKNQAEFARIAKEVDPSKTPAAGARRAGDHPPRARQAAATPSTTSSTRSISFIRAHHIITIPSDVQPTLEETPPFMRATTQASMDSPGPFETHSTKAYFNVTLPEKDWSAERIAEHMAAFNVGTIVSTTVHEAYPGHYVQFLYSPQLPIEDPQAPRRQHQHRRLGPLLRADDARRRLRRRAAQRYARIRRDRPSSSASASCRTRCCATPASSSPSSCTPARHAPSTRPSTSSSKRATSPTPSA